MDPKKYEYWSNSSIERNDASISNFLDDIDKNLITPSTAGGILKNIYYNLRDWVTVLIDNPLYGGTMLFAIIAVIVALIALIVTASSEDITEKAKEE